jgi:hypothetical protein
MDFRLDYGPWETIFTGQTYGHEVEIVTNPENFFIVLIFDKRDGKRMGAVVEGYKALYARGQMESFIQTLPKTSFGVEKSLGDKTGKIFFLSFDPFYIDFRQEDFTRKIDLAIKRIDEGTQTIIDLAKASALDLLELTTVPKTDYAPILGDPFFIKTLVAGQRGPDLAKIDLSKGNYLYEEKAPSIQLGLSKTREIIKETSSNLKRTQILGTGSALRYSMYILSENLLLENIPLIIIDSTNYFDGLGLATSDSFALKEELVEFEPMGFPMRQLTAKESIKVSLKDTDLFFVLDLLGMNDPEFQKNISLLAVALRSTTPEELIEKILQTKELSDYDKLRAERILRIIAKKFNGLFGEDVPSAELTKLVPGKLGRAVIIDTKPLSKEEKILFTHTILRQLTKSFSETQQGNCTLILPDAGQLFEQSKEKTSTALMRLENRGVGIIFGAEKDVPEELDKTLTAKMSIVSGKDVAVSIKSKRNYRVILRPSLSGKPKTE